MNRQEFLDRLRAGLAGLPKDEAAERLNFYSEMIDDRMEDGLSEEEAVDAIGPADRIVEQIISEIPLQKLVKERVRRSRRLSVLEIVLLVLGSPIWLSLLIAFAAIVFSVYVVIWAVIVSLWAVEISFIAGAVGCLLMGIMFIFMGESSRGLIMISSALVLAGLAVFLFLGCKAVTKGAVILTKKIALWTKSLFIRKEN